MHFGDPFARRITGDAYVQQPPCWCAAISASSIPSWAEISSPFFLSHSQLHLLAYQRLVARDSFGDWRPRRPRLARRIIREMDGNVGARADDFERTQAPLVDDPIGRPGERTNFVRRSAPAEIAPGCVSGQWKLTFNNTNHTCIIRCRRS
jgi:hypothetical protein